MWAQGPPRYYRPYESGSESESESESEDSWTSSGASTPSEASDSGPNFAGLALQLARSAGPSFSTIQTQIDNTQERVSRNLYLYPYQAPQESPDASLLQEFGQTKFATEARQTTSLILIDSRNRDRQVYTQPTFFTLRLPRIYKYVTNVQLTQIKLLCSFYYFRPDKNNITVSFREQGRLQPFTSNLATYQATIRTGTYSISALLTELTNQMNKTPLFYDYANGFNDFNAKFQTNGYYGLNFNEPGDNYYDPITQTFTSFPTKPSIINRFWKTLYAGQLSYTTNQSKTAYYYPVVKWAFMNNNTDFLSLSSALTIDPSVTTASDLSNRVLYTFTGINDPVIQEIINTNLSSLDAYRLSNTFRYYPVNKYVFAVEPQSQFITISEPSLNTSLLNLLQIQSGTYLSNALFQNNMTLQTYCNTVVQVNRLNAILQQMYAYNQAQFLNYFAVPYNQYSIEYYSHLNWTILLRNGIGVTSLPTNLEQAEAQGVVPYTTNILEAQRKEPVHYWPRYQSNTGVINTVSNTIYMTNLSNPQFSNLNHPYNVATKSFVENNFNIPVYFINPTNHYIFTDITHTGNCIVPIQASKYSVFKFHSPVRQTLQVETLQRPLDYRVPDYNLIHYGSTIIENFDASYAYIPYTNMPYSNPTLEFKSLFDNLLDSKLFRVPGWQTSNAFSNSSNWSWGLNLNQTREIWQSNGAYNLDINSLNKSIYFQFTTPDFSNAKPGSNYRYTLNLNFLLGNDINVTSNYTPVLSTADIRVLIYGDRGAFQADTAFNRNESPYNYKMSTIITTSVSTTTMSFDVFPKQDYYLIVRPDVNSFGQVFVSVSPYFDTVPPRYDELNSDVSKLNPATDVLRSDFTYVSSFQYAKLYDPAFLHLPVQSNLWEPNPTVNESTRVLDISGVPLGYDVNGISSDYTDYIPFTPNSEFFTFDPNRNKTGLDPVNKYQFQKNSPYNIETETYIYSNSSNIILTPGLKLIYLLSNIPKRQQKISHYYSLTYIMDSAYANSLNNIIYKNEAQQPFVINTTSNTRIRGYKYASSVDSNQQYLTLGKGVIGFSFLPTDGVWDINSVVFRSALSDSNLDPNREITYLGVFNMLSVSGKPLREIYLSNAIACLSSYAIHTFVPNSASVFDGGFDAKGGTYYEFRKYEAFTPLGVSTIGGAYQKESEMINGTDKLYSVIAFDKSSNVTYMRALSGSLIPYPLYNNVKISSNYIDSNFPPNVSYDLLYPVGSNQTYYSFASNLWSNFAPPVNYESGTQSVFEESMPIGTSVVHYNNFNSFSDNSNELWPFKTPFVYNQLITTVKDYLFMMDVNASVFYYDSNSSQRDISTSNLHWYITTDTLTSAYDNQELVGLTGTTIDFIIYGVSESSPTQQQVLISKANPIHREVNRWDLPTPIYVTKGGTFRQVYFKNTNDYLFSYRTQSNTTLIYWSVASGASNFVHVVPSNLDVSIASDCTGGPVYYMFLNSNGTGSNTFYRITDLSNASAFSNATPFTIVLTEIASASNFYSIGMNWLQNSDDEELFFLTRDYGYTSNVYGLASWSIQGQTAYLSKYAFTPETVDSNGLVTLSMQGGYAGSRWLTVEGEPRLWANRNSPVDVSFTVGSAWQIFYPFQKISLVKLANSVTSITDLTGINYQEFPHTQTFYYSNITSLCNDIQYKWGQESSSNFTVASVNFNGYYFNSYIFNIPLRASSNEDYQYITVRNYSPTEQSQVMMRFYLPGEYDFGYLTFMDMFSEIYLAQQGDPLFNITYSEIIQKFDQKYILSNVSWGDGVLQDYGGSTIKFTGFSSFAITYSTIYTQYQESSKIVSTINATVASNVQGFINSQLSNILPASALNRQNYTDAIPTSFLWKSSLLPQYANLLDEWGMGWNLGFAKRDTPYSTFIRADSFYKILDEYIYLRLNPEYRLNSLDLTAKEDFRITRDPTGQIQNYHAKILLNSFGNYTQTAVIVPAQLNPPLPRLDQMSFELTDVTGTRLNNVDCEWNASLQIVEQTNSATAQSVLPRLV